MERYGERRAAVRIEVGCWRFSPASRTSSAWPHERDSGRIIDLATQTPLTQELLEYLREISLRDDECLRELRDETERYPMGAAMQVMAEEGQLLEFLVKLVSARNALEVGTFTGYSTLCIAKGLAQGGRLVTCDISKKWLSIAQPYWQRADVCDVIEPRIGDARVLLSQLLAEVGANFMDFIFIDADKAAYSTYYELGLSLLRPGGLMLVDNTLYFGRVLDAESGDADTLALRRFNELVRGDNRVDLSVLPMADGITMVRKR